jgi:hypothetical protein
MRNRAWTSVALLVLLALTVRGQGAAEPRAESDSRKAAKRASNRSG